MTARTSVVDLKTKPLPKARQTSKAGRFDQITIGLHWLTLVLVIGQFATAWWLSAAADDGVAAANLLTVHRSLGVVTWTVVAFRLTWRIGFAHKPPFPPRMPRLQQLAARLNEWGLYLLLLLQPLTGLGDSVFRGRPFMLLIWRVPSLTHVNKVMFHELHALHELGAIALLGLISLHATAALLHGVILRDGVLQRMLPWTAPDR